jgi:DNA primase
MSNDPNAAKYQIRARISAEGVIDKPDVVGAVFGQTEGLLGDELDLRDLQKSGRIGRIEVEIDSRKGKSEGEILIPSSLDQVETAILASGLETVDRIGPCRAKIEIISVEDIRIAKREKIVERAKMILQKLQEEAKGVGIDLTESVRKAVQVEEITTYGPEHLPAGPNIDQADALIVVEGRSDVLNLLRCGIKNVIAVEGTSVPQTVKDLSRGKTVTVFTDGDRAGELILREMLQTMDIDFVARAPRGSEVEELTQKQLVKCLRNKIPINQYLEMTGFESSGSTRTPMDERAEGSEGGPSDRRGGERRDERRDDRREDRRDNRREPERERMPPPPPPNRPAPMPVAPPPPPAALSPELQRYFELLGSIENASRSLILGADDAVVREAPIKEMIETIQALDVPAKTLIFDGVVSQRLLDVAQEKGISTVIANRVGAVGKIPEGLRVVTKLDLQPQAAH